MRALKNFPLLAGCAAALSLMGTVIFILFFWPGDISANRTGNQLVLGATYMTIRIVIIAALVCLYAFGQFEIISLAASPVPFSAYLDFYNQFARTVFTGVETILVSANVLLFVLFMILLFTGERAEKQRIRKLYEQLNDANIKLRDYAVELEHMTEIRERNRFAREIHDTLGHTLTGIIMGADAALALFPIAPEESRKRVEIIAQSAREGLTDVRRSIKALRPDALEQHTLSEALAEPVDKFRMSTGVDIQYEQLAGTLSFGNRGDGTGGKRRGFFVTVNIPLRKGRAES